MAGFINYNSLFRRNAVQTNSYAEFLKRAEEERLKKEAEEQAERERKAQEEEQQRQEALKKKQEEEKTKNFLYNDANQLFKQKSNWFNPRPVVGREDNPVATRTNNQYNNQIQQKVGQDVLGRNLPYKNLMDKIENERKIIEDQGREGNDPARIRAEYEMSVLEQQLEDLKKKEASAADTLLGRKQQQVQQEQKKVLPVTGRPLIDKLLGITEMPAQPQQEQRDPRKDYISTPVQKDPVQEKIDQARAGNFETPAMIEARKKYGEDSFIYQSMKAQLNDPNSKMNRVTNWMDTKQEDLQDPQKRAQYVNEGRELGLFNTKNPKQMSIGQLEANIKQKEEEIARKKAQENQRNDMSPEQLQQLKDQSVENDEMVGIFARLGEYGVPTVHTTNPDELNTMEYIKERPEDYDLHRDDYDRMLYDEINGQGAYDQRIDALETDRDVDVLESEMDQLWDEVEDGTIANRADPYRQTYREQQGLINGTANTTQDEWELKQLQSELDDRNTIERMTAEAPEVSGAYNRNANKTNKVENNLMNRMFLPGMIGAEFDTGDEIDKLYDKVNNPFNNKTTEYLFGEGNTETDVARLAEMNPAYFMTKKQRDTFNKYYNSGNKEQAQAFYDALERSFLSQMQHAEKSELEKKMSQNEYAPLMMATRAITPEIGGIMGTIGAVKALAGDREAQDYTNETYYGISNANRNIQEGRAEVWGNKFAEWFGEGWRKAGERASGTAWSIVDNLRRAIVTKGVSGSLGLAMDSAAAKTVDFMMLGSDVMSNTMAESLEKNMSPTESFVNAAGQTFIEVLTENMGWDAVFSPDMKDVLGNKRSFAKYLSNIFNAEGMEEVSGNVLETIFDEVRSELYGHDSELEAKYKELRDQKVPEDEARRQVLGDWFKEVGYAYLSGGISSLAMGAGRAITTRASYNSANRAEATAAIREGRIPGVIEAAKGVDGGEAYQQKISEIEEQFKKNGNLTKREAINLFKTVREVGSDVASDVARSEAEDYAKEEINKRMEKAGTQADAATVQAASEAAAELLTGDGELTKKQQAALKQIPEAMQMVSDMMGEAQQAATLKERIKRGQAGVNQAVSSIREAVMPAARNEQRYEDTSALATAEEIGRAEGTRTNSATEVVADGKIADIVKIEKGKAKLSDGREIDLADVKATGSNAAKVLAFAKLDGNKMGSDRFTNTLLQFSKVEASSTLLSDAMKIRVASMLGKSTPQTSLRQEVADAIRETSLQDFEDAENRRLEGSREIKPGNGMATFDGAEFGTEEWKDKMKGLTRQQRREAYAVASLAEKAGFDVSIINDTNQDAMFGSASLKGIVVNMAGTEANGEHHNALVTFGHEITHMLESTSRAGYASLREYVLQNLEKSGMNVENRIEQMIDNYAAQGVDIDMNGAIAEIVANGCDQVLSDEATIRHLQETDGNLYDKLRGVVMDLVDRVKNAIAGMTGSASREGGLLLNNLQELGKKWQIAYTDALTAENGEGEKETQFALMDNKGKRFNEQANEYFSKKGMRSDRAFVLDNSLQDGGIRENHIMMKQFVVTKALRAESGSRSAHGDTITEADIRATNRNLRNAEVVIERSDGTQLVMKARPGKMPIAYAVHHANVYGEDVADIASIHGRSNPLAYYAERMENGEYTKVFVRENGKLQQLPGTTSHSQAASLLENVLNIPQQSENSKTQMSLREEQEQRETEAREAITKAISNPGTQFAMREPVEATKKGLVAVHNLTTNNLMDTLQEGGFTAPSIAIIRAAMGHSKYGEISVLFKKDTIDPQGSNKNKVYGTDAWTPTRGNAQIATQLNSDRMNAIRDQLGKVLDTDEGRIYRDQAQNWINQYIYDNSTTESLDDMTERAYYNDGMIAAFRTDKRMPLEKKTSKRKIHESIHEEKIGVYNEFLDELSREGLLDEFMEDRENLTGFALMEKYMDAMERSGETGKRYVDVFKEKESRLSRNIIYNTMKAAGFYQEDGRQILTDDVYDPYETANAMREATDKTEFANWIRNLTNGMLGKKGVYNGKDLFTSSGNRRSFNQLYMEPTAENIVRAMYANHDAKGGEAGGATGLMAKASKEYSSVQDIRNDAGRLQMMDEEEYKGLINQMDEKLNTLMEGISQNQGQNWDYREIRAAFIEAGEQYAKNPKAETIRKYLTGEGIKITESQLKDAVALMEEAREIPTGYFEAKPERVVDFSEIAKVIMPANEQLEQMLDERGIPYEIYDGTDEDRKAKLNGNEDVQFSFRDETQLDVNQWMSTVSEHSLQTEAERQLLRNYKGLRLKYELQNKKESDIRNKMALIEAVPEGERTKEQERMLKNLGIRLENARLVREQVVGQLNQATGEEGFARMMYQQRQTMENFIYGHTQAEVRDSVEAMERNAKTIQARIEENKKRIEEIQNSGVMGKVRSLLGTTTVDQVAADLKKQYHSGWTKAEIRNYLDPILLKMSQGEDFSGDIEELAGILIGSDTTMINDELAPLRGLTITIGPGQKAELKAQNSSLKEIRRRLAGTGIRVQYGEYSTLDKDIEDLRAEYPMLPDLGNEKDALENFVSWVEGMKDQSGQEFYPQRLAEAIGTVARKAASAASGIYIPTESRARQQVMDLIEYVKGLQAETKAAQQTLTEVAAQMDQMAKQGQQATGRVNMLTRDINVALDYYNRTAQMAEDSAKQRKQSEIIQQLKSKHAEQILKNNEEWRNLIERDKNARQQAVNNAGLRSTINTDIKRLYRLLSQPTNTKNVPEALNGLARHLVETFVDNDLSGLGNKLTKADKKQLAEAKRRLDAWNQRDGEFNLADLNDAEGADSAPMAIINSDLMTIYDAIREYNGDYRGNKLEILQQRGKTLSQLQEAVSEIYGYIQSQRKIVLGNRKIAVEDQAYKVTVDTRGKIHKEWTGKVGSALGAMHKAIVSGNMTPEYFFRGLKNEGLSELWDGYHEAENRNGLELKKAKQKIGKIAERYGYNNWDMNQRVTVPFANRELQMTVGQLMSLYATWNREAQLGPEMSDHLRKGGFFAEQDLREGILGKAEVQKKAQRVTEADMTTISNLLTEEQKDFVNDIVEFMSNDMSELGNEASMKAYGIKLYKEKYYFPMQMWDGIKNRKSNDAGGAAGQDRAFHPSFSKSRMHGANNALIIGDFMQTVTDHVAGMINYATMGLANENFQKVLNSQVTEGYGKEATKRNVRTVLEEAYGREAMSYLSELQKQLNGGAVRIEKTVYDKAISMFRKNAVAGSLSVAAQQPMSYIRAAMMINPKYLARAIVPDVWKGSYKEMMEHSGVAVIKDMGRFDMNFGQSARDYLTPDGKEGKIRKAWDTVTEKATILPELMDRATWTRMWSAVKAEQMAENPGADFKSDEFLDKVGVRFNELMRRTQVYDSVLVKSANMRNQNPAVKMITSFMAEPTLTANVLADSVRMAIQGEKGGKAQLGKAVATFLLSAVAQAAIKAGFGTGRSPDDKKNGIENWLYRFTTNIISEVDPLTLIPGYGNVVDAVKGSSISDDAWGTIQKIFTSGQTGIDLLLGNNKNGVYRSIEDSVGQLVQLFTNLPAKNLMRDARAMQNWVAGMTEEYSPYAWRKTNENVLNYQTKDAFFSADNVIGTINTLLKDAGYDTSNKGYYKRIYAAKKEGNEQEAQNMIDYLLTGKGVKEEKTINGQLNTLAKNDDSLTANEKINFLQENGYGQMGSYIKKLYGDGEITREEAEKLYRKVNPKAKDKDVLEALDSVDYKKAGGETENYSNYTRLREAIEANDAEAFAKEKQYLTDNGYKESDVNSQIRSYITDQYADGKIDRTQAENQLKTTQKDMDANDIWFTLDRIDYKKETGEDASGEYYRLKRAIQNGKSEEIRNAVNMMTKHGKDAKDIQSWIGRKDTGFKTAYLTATGSDKVRIKNALIMAYKALGLGITDAEANEIINKWK